MATRPTLGLVLSGGGIRGVAHVGVIHALREHGIQVDHYAGTSAGALVGLMAAAGCSIEEMLDFWTESEPFHVRHLAFDRTGMFNTASYVQTLKKFVGYESFEELPYKLTVTATAMLKGEVEYIDSGPLWPILLGSAAYPMVFNPIRLHGEIYMDGGITDNFPVRAIRKQCDVLVGVNVSARRKLVQEDFKSLRDIIERVMDIQFGVTMDAKKAMLDHIIIPKYLESYGTFDVTSTLEIYRQGFDAGVDAVGRIRELLAI